MGFHAVLIKNNYEKMPVCVCLIFELYGYQHKAYYSAFVNNSGRVCALRHKKLHAHFAATLGGLRAV
jgi:hypothetical protein